MFGFIKRNLQLFFTSGSNLFFFSFRCADFLRALHRFPKNEYGEFADFLWQVCGSGSLGHKRYADGDRRNHHVKRLKSDDS